MQPQSEILQTVISTLTANTSIKSIKINALPVNGGVCVEITSGGIKEEYFSRKTERNITLLFTSKNLMQNEAYDNLCEIANYLQSLKDYPNGTMFEWIRTEINEPTLVTKQADGYYIYGCVIDIIAYF